jgi:hypothetical protein
LYSHPRTDHPRHRAVKLKLVDEALRELAYEASERRAAGGARTPRSPGERPLSAGALGRGGAAERFAEEQARRERAAKKEALARAAEARAALELRRTEERIAGQQAKEEALRRQHEALALEREQLRRQKAAVFAQRKIAASERIARTAAEREAELSAMDAFRKRALDQQRAERAAAAAAAAAEKTQRLLAARADADVELEAKRRAAVVREIKGDLRQTELEAEQRAAAAALRGRLAAQEARAKSARTRVQASSAGRRDELQLRLASAERRRLGVERAREHEQEVRRTANAADARAKTQAAQRAAAQAATRRAQIHSKMEQDDARAAEAERRRAIDRMLRREEKRCVARLPPRAAPPSSHFAAHSATRRTHLTSPPRARPAAHSRARRLHDLDIRDNLERLKRADAFHRQQLERRIAEGGFEPARRALSPRPGTPRAPPARPLSARTATRAAAPTRARPSSARVYRPGVTDELAALRRAQNDQLLAVLEAEASAEKGREAALKRVVDATERRRLDKIFGHERAEASASIIRLTAEHEAQLARRMQALGLL